MMHIYYGSGTSTSNVPLKRKLASGADFNEMIYLLNTMAHTLDDDLPSLLTSVDFCVVLFDLMVRSDIEQMTKKKKSNRPTTERKCSPIDES